MLRTHSCGDLRLKDVNKKVMLSGWVQRIRAHGGIVFIDLMDRYGITQLVFNKKTLKANFHDVMKLTKHSTITIKGVVKKRPKGTENPNLSTGKIEVVVEDLTIHNITKPLPISLQQTLTEEMKLKYRPIYMRKQNMQHLMNIRSKATYVTMDYFYKNGFVYVETPILAKPTPEGARDFLVPSRIHAGKFYALPQSPQQYKQKLMIGCVDKYFQLAKCLRDEDLRADRQPEFTQIDVEMSWVEEKDIFTTIEGLIKRLFEEILNIKVKTPFLQLKYDDVMSEYGSDKPDLRNPLKIKEISNVFKNTRINVFNEILARKGRIYCIKITDGSNKFSNKLEKDWVEFAKKCGEKGLVTMEIGKTIKSVVSKYMSESEKTSLLKITGAKENDVLVILATEKESVETLGKLREKIAMDLDIIDKNRFSFAWITEFPLFEYSKEEQRWTCKHHPFTSPEKKFIDELMSIQSIEELENPEHIKSRAYDLVINGWEVGGGSIRIHNRYLQERMFQLLGMSKNEYISKFGSLLNLLELGAPPHGGIALGFDRLVSILAGVDSIRDVIAFPKSKDARCLMDDSPSKASEEQLKELHICIEED